MDNRRARQTDQEGHSYSSHVTNLWSGPEIIMIRTTRDSHAPTFSGHLPCNCEGLSSQCFGVFSYANITSITCIHGNL